LKQKKTIPIIVGIVTVVAIASAVYFYDGEKPSNEFKSQWISSGPFAISQPKYKLGENVFLTVHELKPNEAGNILIIQPNGDIWTSIPFNGTRKNTFNYYFKPDTSAALKIYGPEELVGTWKVIFQGLTYEPLSFEIINEFIQGAEGDIIPIPRPNETKQ
jgi:hypothetical protein